MIGLFLSLSDEGWGRDGIGCSQGQGVGGIPLALKSCCQTLEDLVVPPGVSALYEAGLTTGQDMFESNKILLKIYATCLEAMHRAKKKKS